VSSNAGITIKAVDRIARAFGKPTAETSSAFVVRFDAPDDELAPDPVVLAASSPEEACEKALGALRNGYPHLKPGDDPLFYWLNARDALRTMLLLETARAGGKKTAQLRRLQRAQAIDRHLASLNDAFAPPKLTKKSHARLMRGEVAGLTYDPLPSPLEALDFGYTEDGRRAALIVCGAPYQPIDVVGMTIEFAALLREAQLYEARLLSGSSSKGSLSNEAVDTEHVDLGRPSPQANVLWINAREAARRLGLSVSYLAQKRVSGGGPNFVRHGRAVRYLVQDLDDWAALRRQSSTSDVHHVS
jgi:hypothetical protein